MGSIRLLHLILPKRHHRCSQNRLTIREAETTVHMQIYIMVLILCTSRWGSVTTLVLEGLKTIEFFCMQSLFKLINMQKKRQTLQHGVGTGPWTRNNMNKAVS